MVRVRTLKLGSEQRECFLTNNITFIVWSVSMLLLHRLWLFPVAAYTGPRYWGVYLHPLKLLSLSSCSMMESKRNKAQCSIVPVPTVNQHSVLGAGCSVQWVVCILQYSVCSVQYLVSSGQYSVCSVQYSVCTVQYAVCNVQYSVCSVQGAVFSVQCVVCSIQSAVCSVQYSVCSI